MRTLSAIRFGAITTAAAFAFVLAGSNADNPKMETYSGKVVPLAGMLEKIGSRLDPDAAPHWLALVTDDNKIYPLIKDGNSRMFFQDRRLQNRPVRLGGRLFEDTRLLQVLSVTTLVKGAPHEVYYWCDICSIRRNELLKQCECCGGSMELREVPAENR
jgi:hypothetical protein